MSTCLVTLNGETVPTEEASGKNVINVNITQESSLSYLFKAVGQCMTKLQEPAPKTSQPSASAPPPPKWSLSNSRDHQKALGAAQILLGIVCISLGAVLELEHIFGIYIYSGAAFWMGGLVVASGAWTVLSARHGAFWISMATVFNLGSVVAVSVALTQGIARIPNLTSTYDWRKGLCERQNPPWVTTPSPIYDWNEVECKDMLWNFVTVAFAIRILLLIFSVAAMAVALFCFGYGLRVLYCNLKANSQDYVMVEDGEVPPPYSSQAAAENIA